jgi:hypothetical protein
VTVASVMGHRKTCCRRGGDILSAGHCRRLRSRRPLISTRTRRPASGRARVALLLALLLVTVSLGALLWLVRTGLWRDLGLGQARVGLTGLEEVTRRSSISFPPGSVLLDGEFHGGLSQYIIAKVSMPLSEVKEFIAQPPFPRKEGVSSTERAFTRADEPAMVERGWDPDSCKRFLSGEGTPTSYPAFVRFVIDLDDPQTAIVYFEWSSA